MASSRGKGLLKQRMGRRGNVLVESCPSRTVLEHVTSRWGTLVLVSLQEGTMRFGELRRQVAGVSEKMLAQTLQILEKDGFVRRQARPVIPPHVEYSLTPLGEEVATQVEGLTDWIEENVGRVLKARERKPHTRG